ncbi:MAG: hypothetical protein JSW54_04860 [Fidelibacterota bacterium]|nr:MAG: hypothetical protein JSW54_04860 [Candidatus Neomarinimicrobiota bacterium]
MATKRSKKLTKPAVPRPVQQPPTPQQKVPPPASRTAARGAVEVTSDSYLSKLSPEDRAKLEAQDKRMKEVLKFAEENPEAASQLLRAWLSGRK